jgi:hypothetical protein
MCPECPNMDADGVCAACCVLRAACCVLCAVRYVPPLAVPGHTGDQFVWPIGFPQRFLTER